jgi:hypothetical protein
MMIEINSMKVQESWTEYGVQVAPDLIIDYDDLAEAEIVAGNFGTAVMHRRGYLTEWCAREPS